MIVAEVNRWNVPFNMDRINNIGLPLFDRDSETAPPARYVPPQNLIPDLSAVKDQGSTSAPVHKRCRTKSGDKAFKMIRSFPGGIPEEKDVEWEEIPDDLMEGGGRGGGGSGGEGSGTSGVANW